MTGLRDWVRSLLGAGEPEPRPAPPPARDVDAEILAGEERLRAAQFGQEVLWPLAAAYHHRGCVRRARGDREAGRSDAARAAELDIFSHYLTTLALFLDEDGARVAARRTHDQAAAALRREESARRGPLGTAFPSPRVDRDAARTLHARGVHLLAAGELAPAIDDLTAATRLAPTPEVWAALSVAHRRAGALDHARRAAERALALDPDSAPARRATAALEA